MILIHQKQAIMVIINMAVITINIKATVNHYHFILK